MGTLRLPQSLRLLSVITTSICLGWILFATMVHEDAEDHMSVVNISPIIRKAGGRPLRSPAPAVRPAGRPSFMDWLGDDTNLRQCQCRKEWKTLPAGEVLCRCRGNCPPHITPEFLTLAAGQALCSLEEQQGYNCYAECENEKQEGPLKWFALPCGNDKQEKCDPPILAKKGGKGAKAPPVAAVEAPKKVEAPPPAPAVVPPAPETKSLVAVVDTPPVAADKFAKLGYNPHEVFDLRGLKCEMLNNVERCFVDDEQGRELCPLHVTHEFLSNPSDQYLCSPDMADQFYCTAGCQEGNEDIRWGAHEISWCDDPRNKGSCPAKTPVIPKKDFVLQQWSEPIIPDTPCQAAWKSGTRPKKPISKVTWGLLTHEPKSFRDSMKTYEALGLFDVMAEFLIYINKRRPEVDAVAEEYRAKYPTVVKIMGDSENHGIARGMSYLTGNASNPYFIFLERDFQLIEPATCVVEQVESGVLLLESKKAHVVRYRHQRHPGRPNWAARMYKGREDDVFKSGQPNLFCNHFYWYDEPEKRWPDKMWICKDVEPRMWCSDSFYCNWTNNPQLWSVAWWKKEYVDKFDSFTQSDPWYDLEMYMNWEPNSWNDRKWTVAQGAGLFKHVDRGNFGIL